jgi:glycogen debranching enzyme
MSHWHQDNKDAGPHYSRSALVNSIAGALVIKDEDVFFLCAPNGELPLTGRHGYGLYYHDCRFLSGYELRVVGAALHSLIASGGAGFQAELELTNVESHLAEGGTIPKEDLAVHWERLIDGSQQMLHDQLTFHNFSMEPYAFPVSLAFGAAFEDVFEVRGMPAKARGKLHPPHWEDDRLLLRYDGTDGLCRGVSIRFNPAPTHQEGTTAQFQIRLGPHEEKKLLITLALTEVKEPAKPRSGGPPRAVEQTVQRVKQSLQAKAQAWRQRRTDCRTSNPLLDRVLQRALLDVHILRSRLDNLEYISGGVPWYVALFGRDGLIAALEVMAYNPGLAEQTLRLLARYQGTKVDDWRDEQPGKILHELRVGELAHDNRIPQTP